MKISKYIKPKFIPYMFGFGLLLLIIVLLIKKKMDISTIKKYIGYKETKGNSGFVNSDFQNEMLSIGWSKGDAWCVYFCMLAWFKMLPANKWAVAKKLLSGNSQVTWSNFSNDKSGLFEVSKTAKIGSIAIFQHVSNGVPQATGHAGIVTDFDTVQFHTIEGNTNDNGSSEGDTVLEKNRTYNFGATNGLRLKGFINVK